MTEPEILFQPENPEQAAFLSASEDYVLGGGERGGGKTAIACIDGLGLNNPGNGKRAIDFPAYHGLFLRRTLNELRNVKDETLKWYPLLGRTIDETTGQVLEPRWFEQEKKWVFPSGATIRFGYLESEGDELRYQGHQYQWICWEELTQWPSNRQFILLNACLRGSKDDFPPEFKLKVRATCNPGGPGHQWVRDFWQIDDLGNPNAFTVAVPDQPDLYTSRRFVRFYRKKNRKLPDDYDKQFAEMSEQVRKAWLFGEWNIVDATGSIYRDQIEILHANGGFRDLPYDPRFPVNTFWDLGTTDPTCVWFHQRVNGVDCFIDYYEQANKGLNAHVNAVRAKGYTYGTHYLPHDAMHKKSGYKGIVMTSRDIIEDLGLRNIIVLPNASINDGIEHARVALPRCRFDAAACARGIECLKNYRAKFDEKLGTYREEPIHDQYSHGSDAFRQFAQALSLGHIEDDMPGGEAERYLPSGGAYSRHDEMQARRRRWKV